MIDYRKLKLLMRSKGMRFSELRSVLSSKTLAKLSKNENVTTDTLLKICNYLQCDIGDICEVVHK